MLAIGTAAWAVALGLVVATGVVGFTTGMRPDLRYGLLPAALLLLASGDRVHGHGASRRRAHLGDALERCSDLLAATVGSLLGEPAHDRVRTISESVGRDIWAAGAVAAQSHYPSRLRRRPIHPRPRTLLRAVERLYHFLLLMTRADKSPLAQQARDELAPVLASFAATGSAYLKSLGSAMAGNAPPPPPGPSGDRARS